MKHNRFLSVLVFVLALLLCAGALAAAEAEVSFVSALQSHINPLMPKGLRYTDGGPDVKDGSITLSIDDSATDWGFAVANSTLNQAQFVFQLKPPFTQADLDAGFQNGTRYAVDMFNFEPGTDMSEIRDLVATNTSNGRLYQHQIREIQPNGTVMQDNGSVAGESGITIGTYLPAAGYLNPESSDMVYYVGWYKLVNGVWELMNGQYETLRVTVKHTHTDAFAVQGPQKLPAKYIAKDISAANAKVEDGSITYSGLAMNQQVTTKITAPEGAVRYASGSLKGSWENAVPADGVVASYDGQVTANRPVYSSTQSFVFYDADGTVMGVYSVNLNYESAKNLPWPAYVDGYQKLSLDSDRLIIENGAEAAGYVQDKSQNHIHFKYDEKQAGSSAAATTGEVRVTVLPPEGANYFRYMNIPKSNHGILGDLCAADTQAERLANAEETFYRMWSLNEEPGDASDWLPFYNYQAFRKIQPQDVPKLSIFVPTAPSMPFTTELLVIHWYQNADDTEPMLREYIWETVDPFEATNYGDIYTSEDSFQSDAQRDKTKIACIISPGLQQAWRGNWQLVVKSYYQEGENARHYEFHLTDKNGKPLVLPEGETLTVYLPFPEEDNFDPQTAVYGLRHYSANLYKEHEKDEDDNEIIHPNDPDLQGTPMTIEVTPYGLRLQTDSFSPFVATWEGGEMTDPDEDDPLPQPPASSTPPKTGDATPLWLLGMLCMLSAAALMIRRRKRA